MSKTTSKRISASLIAMLAILLVAVSGFSIANGIAYADSNEILNAESSLTVGHMSDIHYFPLEYCYQDVKNENYTSSDFYYSMTGDTKLVLESGVILNQQIKGIIADAKAGIAPQFLIASGDLCKNGEHVALIDVANSLRYLQNEVRKQGGKYTNFQVFAMVGNHDLYNHDGAVYSQTDGSGSVADGVTSAQYALIFAGLGFPNANLNGDGGAINLTDYLPEDYWSSSYTSGYQASNNAENINITYYSHHLNAVKNETTSQAKLAHYYALGDDINQLTFFAELQGDFNRYSFAVIDSTDRETVELGSIVRIGKAEFDALGANKGVYTYFLENADGTINEGEPITNLTTVANALAQNKHVYRATKRNHYTGGRITENCLNWIESCANAQNADGEETIVAVCHQNVLPHWDQEDDILKDFTLYNWEYTAKRFLKMGIRYTLTGHMHASDIMTYTDVEGRTLYDFETGSCVSYSSPRRYITLSRYMNENNNLAEQCVSSVHSIDNLKEVASNNIFACSDWNQSAFDSARATYVANPTHENWLALVDSNPEYLTYIIQYDDLSTLSFDEYISKDIYSQLVDRIVDHFLNERLVDSLKGMVETALSSDGTVINMVAGLITGGDKTTLNSLAQYIIDSVLYWLYPDTNGDEIGNYPYGTETYDGAFDYLLAIVEDVLNLEYGSDDIASTVNPTNAGKLNVKEIASFIMTSHCAGIELSMNETLESIAQNYTEKACGDNHYAYMLPTDKTYRMRMLAAVKDMHAQLVSGQFVQDLLDSLLNPLFINDNSLLKTLFAHSFDFNDAVAKGYITQDEYDTVEYQLGELTNTLNSPLISSIIENYLGAKLTLPENFEIPADNLVLGSLVNALLPVAKPLLSNLLGFNLVGDDIIQIVQGFLDDYLTESFYVGLGGIADGIIIAFATDEIPDYADNTNPVAPFTVQPYEGYEYANTKLSYLSALDTPSSVGAEINPATQENGRVPSRVTTNFDTVNGQTEYVIKFYTEEFIYGRFDLADAQGNNILSLSTGAVNADLSTDYADRVATTTVNGITVNMLTQTKPVYVPLIDLGILCLTHAEVDYDVEGQDDPVPYKYGERDNAPKNSVIYWNVTTISISGLAPNTAYTYDIAGSTGGEALDSYQTKYFSLVDYARTQGYDKEHFTLKTAADRSVTDFEFLTIADIQGMIQGMYDTSVKAVDALLGDERTNTFDFILNAGDMCDNGKNFNQWGMALNTYQRLFLNTSMFFTAGNHEKGSNALNNFFAYSVGNEAAKTKDGIYYSFDYANAHFTVLNTNDANSNGLGAEQFAWLQDDLANTDAKWKFVLMHKSLYSGGSHSRDAEVVAMREQLVPLFANNGVNMVFAGHDHTYTSTFLVDANGNAVDKSDIHGVQYTGDGVLYITLGTLGTKFYEYGTNDDVTPKFDDENSILGTLNSQTFGKVVVSGDTITYTGYIYDRDNDCINEIGDSTLSATKVLYKAVVIALCVCIPCVVILSVATALIVLKKKGKLGKK